MFFFFFFAEFSSLHYIYHDWDSFQQASSLLFSRHWLWLIRFRHWDIYFTLMRYQKRRRVLARYLPPLLRFRCASTVFYFRGWILRLFSSGIFSCRQIYLHFQPVLFSLLHMFLFLVDVFFFFSLQARFMSGIAAYTCASSQRFISFWFFRDFFSALISLEIFPLLWYSICRQEHCDEEDARLLLFFSQDISSLTVSHFLDCRHFPTRFIGHLYSLWVNIVFSTNEAS